jgi:hypothetical protein
MFAASCCLEHSNTVQSLQLLIFVCARTYCMQVYYLGVQTAVPKRENGQCAANPGWIYAMGLHA